MSCFCWLAVPLETWGFLPSAWAERGGIAISPKTLVLWTKDIRKGWHPETISISAKALLTACELEFLFGLTGLPC